MSTMADTFGETIWSYSRADAIQDGVLVEVPADITREAGIRFSVACSDHLWSYVSPDYMDELPGQSESGRLWELLHMFRLAAVQQRQTDRLTYRVIFVMKRFIGNKSIVRPETVTVQAICGPGDNGEPVITLMLPGDD